MDDLSALTSCYSMTKSTQVTLGIAEFGAPFNFRRDKKLVLDFDTALIGATFMGNRGGYLCLTAWGWRFAMRAGTAPPVLRFASCGASSKEDMQAGATA